MNFSIVVYIIICNNEGGNMYVWNSGIVFMVDVLIGIDGSVVDNGLGEVMSLVWNYYIGWYVLDMLNGFVVIIIFCVIQMQNWMWQFFVDDVVVFDSFVLGGVVFCVQYVVNGVNYLQVINGLIGSGVIFVVVGFDVNINLWF